MRRYCQHLLQKLSNNGGVDAAIELDDKGKGLVDWKEV